MARFRFRLATVLDHRRRVERDRQLEVARIEIERRALEEEIRACRDRLTSERAAMRVDLGANAKIDVTRLRWHAGVSGSIVGEAQRAVLKLAGVHQRLETARAALLEATTARKAVETLEQRALEAWRLQERRKEERELDELNVIRAGAKESP